jgi:two-component system phosphate regulon sensor histidine kinase PhoR
MPSSPLNRSVIKSKMKNDPPPGQNRFQNILWKWWASSLFLVLVTLLLIGWISSDLLENEQISQIKKELLPQAILAGSLLSPLFSDHAQPDALARRVESLGNEVHARVTAIRIDGRVLGDSYEKGAAFELMENHLQRAEIQEAIQKGVGTAIRFSDTVKMRMVYLAVPLKNGNELIGFVRLALPLTELSQQTSRMKKDLFLVFLAVFVISIPIAYLLSKRLTRPLLMIIEAASSFGHGDLTKRIRIRTGDEIEKLANTFNQMANEISLRLKEISGERSQLSAVLNGMIEGIMILNSEGKVLLTNPSLNQMFSLHAPIQKETRYYELIRHHDLNEFIRKVLTDRNNQSIDISFTHPRESFFQVQASVAPGKQVEETFYMVLVFHEITEMRKLERVRKDFVANVSHELRTPLTSIKGYLDAISESEPSLTEEGKKFLLVLQKQSLRMENIVTDLLQLARIESGKEKLQLVSISIKSFLEKTVASLSPLAEKKGQNIEIQAPEELILQGDPDKVTRILINLIENAIKYTPESGKIVVGCQSMHDSIELFVKDNGIGIPPADQNRIFERFYRVDRARSREMGGTGLGLSIVKHLVEAHGGTIRVESYPNEGATFKVRFPATSV